MFNFPIQYEEPVFRPPSEGRSILIQMTIGCSNNKCTYCNMYRSKTYRERSYDEVLLDIENGARYFNSIGMFPEKLFLCDGDALGADSELIKKTLKAINTHMPFIKRVGIYATAQNMLDKSLEELKEFKELGLGICYLGMESGSDKVLHLTVKGNDSKDMIKGSKRVIEAGLDLSIICMLGLGGKKLSVDHVENTAKALSAINPQYLSFLTTMAVEGTPFHRLVSRGGLEMLTVKELLGEMKDILALTHFSKDVLFRTNHVSNMYPIGGTLPVDNEVILKTLNEWYENTPEGTYPPKPSHM